MEVIKPTDVLEKQILEDARRKAGKLLDNAEKEIKKQKRETDECIRTEEQRLKDRFQTDLKQIETELNASLPLDLFRMKIKYIDGALRRTLAEVMEALKPEELLAVIEYQLTKVEPVLKGREITGLYNGVNEPDLARGIKKVLPQSTLKGLEGDASFKGLVLSTTDTRIKVKLTLAQLEENLLSDWREGLFKELFHKSLEEI